MKLLDAIQKKRGNPYWIPDCSRNDLPELFVQLGFKQGVEVGVSWGEFIVRLGAAGLAVTGVDPWQDTEDNTYHKIVSIDGKYGRTIDGVYKLACQQVAPYPKCKLLKKLSVDAVNDFADRSLDFIYIDANHMFGYVAMDLMKWCNKVRKGGIIAGHDYLATNGNRQIRFVHYIVNAFAQAYDFDNWYVLGGKKAKKNEVRDRELSFMFIKHW